MAAAKLNYATEYQSALEQEFPYVLYFGDLFSTPNNKTEILNGAKKLV